MGLDPESLENWETNRTRIAVRFFPALIAFLGYNPLPEARTRGEEVRRRRMTLAQPPFTRCLQIQRDCCSRCTR